MGKKVLVTGGFGRVGSSVIPMLLKDGYKVKVLGRHDKPDAPYRNDIEVCVGDLSNYEFVYNAIGDTDIVCHLAAQFPPLFFDEAKIIESNVLGTFNVLQAMKNSGRKRIVFASTDAVYATGASLDAYKGPLTEDMPLNPINVYGITKVVNETAIKKYARLFDFSYVILRFFWSMRSEEMIRLMFEARNYINDILAEDRTGITEDTIIELRCEDGSKYYDHITDFRDIALGTYLAIKKDDVHNEVFNIAAQDLLDYSVQSKKIADSLKRSFRTVRVKGIKNYRGDIGKAQRILGYTPKYSMDDMIREALGGEK